MACLDTMATESEGKELELMTKDKQCIALLEKDRLIQSSYKKELDKENRLLKKRLTESEMKLRQSQNESQMKFQRMRRGAINIISNQVNYHCQKPQSGGGNSW